MIIKEAIYLDANLKNQTEVFDFIANKLLDLDLINNKEQFVLALKKREAEISTAVGFEIAMPHCQDHSIKQPFVAYIKLKEQIDWKSEKVKMVFVIGVNKSQLSGNTHLKILSALSKLLMHENFRKELATSIDQDTIYQKLKLIEERN